MKKKSEMLVLPETPQELLSAIAKTQAIAERVERFNAQIASMPAAKGVAETALKALNTELAKKETELMLAEESMVPSLQAEIEALTAQVYEKQGEIGRSGLRLTHMNAAGEVLYAELAAAQVELQTEKEIYARAVREVVADKIVTVAEELAVLGAVHREFAVAAGYSLDWHHLCHVSDPRLACTITAGGHIDDDAPNLLLGRTPEAIEAATATRMAVRSLKDASQLARRREFVPLKEKLASQWQPHASSEGPNGRPHTPSGSSRAYTHVPPTPHASVALAASRA